MNGGGGVATTTHNNNNDISANTTTPIGSRKRKRGLAPQKTEARTSPPTSQAALVKKASATTKVAPNIVLPKTTKTMPPSLSMQNGHNHKATKAERKLAPPKVTAASKSELIDAVAACCSMCGKDQPHSLVDLSANVVMKQTLTTCWMVPVSRFAEEAQNLKSTLASVCVQCIYKINAFKDMKHSLKIRMRRLAVEQMVETEAPKEKMEEDSCQDAISSLHLSAPVKPAAAAHNKSNASSEQILDRSITPPPYSPLESTQLRTPPDGTLDTQTAAELSESVKDLNTTPNKNDKNSIIEVKVMTPVATKNEKQASSVPTPPSSPSSLAALANSETIPAPAPAPVLSQLSVVATVANSRAVSIHSPILNHSMLEVFCERSESALITESGGKINNYQQQRQNSNSRRLPAPQLTCVHCARAYWRKDYYAKHVRRCGAQHRRAKSLAAVSAKRSPAPPQQSHDLDDTLKQVPAASMASNAKVTTAAKEKITRVFHCSECAVTVDNISKLREHKRIHLQRFYCGTCGSEFTAHHNYEFHRVVCEAHQDATSEAVTMRMTRARFRAATQISVTNRRESMSDEDDLLEHNEDKDYIDEGDYDDMSQVDTMYTKRMRFTGNWVEDHYSSKSDLTSGDNHFNDYDDDHQISTYKEYDLYLLDCLKLQIYSNEFTCFSCHAANIIYSTKTLPVMMLHDYIDHFKRAFFYCKKCGRCFSSKVFLDYHLDRQNGGRFICFKCGDIFEFQHQLDRHLIRHTKSVNYRCNYCKFEFLTESELLQHCEIEQHDPNGERHLIRIDPAMTLVNRVPPTADDELNRRRHGYSVRIIDMRLPRCPSKRPLQLSPNFRQKIGDVEFINQKNHNCWGWK